MPRENREPFPCSDCRFNIDGYCWRNPAQTSYLNFDQIAIRPVCEVVKACFVGEPDEVRSCDNCARAPFALCPTHGLHIASGITKPPGWHCTDWKLAEGEG